MAKGLKSLIEVRQVNGREKYFFNKVPHEVHATIDEMTHWLLDRKVPIRATMYPDESRILYFRTPPEFVAEFTAQFIGQALKNSCQYKHVYRTEDEAMSGVFRTMMKQNYRPKFNHRLLPYRCPDCGKIHIGHQFGTLEYHAE